MAREFPKTFASLRKELGETQRDTAKGLGISQTLVSQYENGTREPGLEFIRRACHYFDVSADYMLGLTEERQPGGMQTVRELLDELTALTEKYGNSIGMQQHNLTSVTEQQHNDKELIP